MSSPAPFDPERLFTTLARHHVEFVLVGALAARLQGFPRMTADADVTPAPGHDNLVRLAAALRELDAKVFTNIIPEGLPFDCTPAMLERGDMWNLVTTAGRLDIIFRPAGTEGFDALLRGAVRFDVYGGALWAASLQDILRSKEAADRPQDRQDALIIREMLRAAER